MPKQSSRPPVAEIPLDRARAFWTLRQGLEAPQPGPLSGVVSRTGWLRTLGGADVYLAVRARVPGASRASLDGAVAARELVILPAVRGCIYLVPREHAATALAFALTVWRPRAERDVERAGARWEEVDALARLVGETLRQPMTTEALRRSLPAGTVRSLGAQGKAVGLSSLLPVALRLLEHEGRIERTPETGRLDTERYLWGPAASQGPRHAPKAGSADTAAELLRIFLAQMGPATLGDFCGWSGLPLRDAKAAAESVGTVSVAVEEYAHDALLLPGDLEALLATLTPDAVRLLAFEDNLLTAHGGPRLLTAPEHRAIEVEVWGSGKRAPLGEAAHVAQRTILARGRVVGFWESDLEAGRVVTRTFERLAGPTRTALAELATETARFLAEEVGHGRRYSLDTDDAVLSRARALSAAS